VVKEAEEFLEAKLPSVRKEARESYVQNSPLLEFAEADVSRLYEQMEVFPDDSMDRILTVNTLYFFPDLLAGLKELRRVLKPHGRMVCVIKCDHVKNSIKEGGQLQREGADTAAQLPASTDLLLQALREAGFGAAVRVTGSVTGDKHAAAMSLAERIAAGRMKQTQDENLRSEPPGVAQWRTELKGLTIAELCRLARGEIIRGKPDAKIRSAQLVHKQSDRLLVIYGPVFDRLLLIIGWRMSPRMRCGR
jgi:ubiquinone/menaquinone biosynthesis C-methylase UbiE